VFACCQIGWSAEPEAIGISAEGKLFERHEIFGSPEHQMGIPADSNEFRLKRTKAEPQINIYYQTRCFISIIYLRGLPPIFFTKAAIEATALV